MSLRDPAHRDSAAHRLRLRALVRTARRIYRGARPLGSARDPGLLAACEDGAYDRRSDRARGPRSHDRAFRRQPGLRARSPREVGSRTRSTDHGAQRFQAAVATPARESEALMAEQAAHDSRALPAYRMAALAATSLPRGGVVLRGEVSGERSAAVAGRDRRHGKTTSRRKSALRHQQRDRRHRRGSGARRNTAARCSNWEADSGAAQSALLERLDAHARAMNVAHYPFTEIFPAFLRRARKSLLARWPQQRFTFGQLDIDQPFARGGNRSRQRIRWCMASTFCMWRVISGADARGGPARTRTRGAVRLFGMRAAVCQPARTMSLSSGSSFWRRSVIRCSNRPTAAQRRISHPGTMERGIRGERIGAHPSFPTLRRSATWCRPSWLRRSPRGWGRPENRPRVSRGSAAGRARTTGNNALRDHEPALPSAERPCSSFLGMIAPLACSGRLLRGTLSWAADPAGGGRARAHRARAGRAAGARHPVRALAPARGCPGRS